MTVWAWRCVAVCLWMYMCVLIAKKFHAAAVFVYMNKCASVGYNPVFVNSSVGGNVYCRVHAWLLVHLFSHLDCDVCLQMFHCHSKCVQYVYLLCLFVWKCKFICVSVCAFVLHDVCVSAFRKWQKKPNANFNSEQHLPLQWIKLDLVSRKEVDFMKLIIVENFFFGNNLIVPSCKTSLPVLFPLSFYIPPLSYAVC